MGLVQLDDTANVVSAVAEGNISGGDWLSAGSYTSTVTSLDAGQFAATKVKVARGGSGTNVIGICLESTQSGTNALVSYSRCGVYILPCTGTVLAGDPIGAGGNGNGAGGVGPTTVAGAAVGRALTTAVSGGYAICQIGL